MKATLMENEGCFGINLQAETLSEAAVLVRMGINNLRELRSAQTGVDKDGTFNGWIVIGKSKNPTSYVPKKK